MSEKVQRMLRKLNRRDDRDVHRVEVWNEIKGSDDLAARRVEFWHRYQQQMEALQRKQDGEAQ